MPAIIQGGESRHTWSSLIIIQVSLILGKVIGSGTKLLPSVVAPE